MTNLRERHAAGSKRADLTEAGNRPTYKKKTCKKEKKDFLFEAEKFSRQRGRVLKALLLTLVILIPITSTDLGRGGTEAQIKSHSATLQ
jgi:hypothetical protein